MLFIGCCQMVWQSSSSFAKTVPAMLLPVEAGPPLDSEPVDGSAASKRRKKRRAAGAVAKKFNGMCCQWISSNIVSHCF